MKVVKVECIENPLLGYVDGCWFRMAYENGKGVAIDIDWTSFHNIGDAFSSFMDKAGMWCDNPYSAFFMYALAMPKQFRPKFWYPDEMSKEMMRSDIDMKIKRQLQGVLIKMKEDFKDLSSHVKVKINPEEIDML